MFLGLDCLLLLALLLLLVGFLVCASGAAPSCGADFSLQWLLAVKHRL